MHLNKVHLVGDKTLIWLYSSNIISITYSCIGAVGLYLYSFYFVKLHAYKVFARQTNPSYIKSLFYCLKLVYTNAYLT
jgi:hypothetical protein